MENSAQIAHRYHSGYFDLAELIPATTSSFGRLAMDATVDGALSSKLKELIAFAIAISVRCDGCLAHHAQAVVKAGVTRQEVADMIGVTILMGGGPSTVYGAQALSAYDEFSKAKG